MGCLFPLVPPHEILCRTPCVEISPPYQHKLEWEPQPGKTYRHTRHGRMICSRCYSTIYVGGEYGYQRGDERPGCYTPGLWYEQHNAQTALYDAAQVHQFLRVGYLRRHEAHIALSREEVERAAHDEYSG